MFPFSARSQEQSYIVSGELHLPPSNLCLEIIQKLLSPRGGTSVIALPPNLGMTISGNSDAREGWYLSVASNSLMLEGLWQSLKMING